MSSENSGQDLSKEYWTSESESFSERSMADKESPVYENIKKFVKELLPARPEETKLRALDIGCGAAFMSMLLADLGCSVTGIDFSKGMLEHARENCTNGGYTDVEFRYMDAQELEFDDESFDFAVIRNVLWMVPDAEAVYSGALRVLKPGGVLLNMDGDYGRGIAILENSEEIGRLSPESQEEVHIRSRIASQLPVSKETRPAWDEKYLRSRGAGTVRVISDIEDYLDIKRFNHSSMHEQAIRSKSQIFAVIAVK